MIAKSVGCSKERKNRMAREKGWRCNKCMYESERKVNTIRGLYMGMLVVTLLYGSESLTWDEHSV